jgi:broad specificity phosphatase PhoE
VPPPVIYYVRHGLTDWNVQHRLQGRHDVPLNREGRAQAVRCAEILCDLFARDGCAAQELAYVSSPLGRARETMELMRAISAWPSTATASTIGSPRSRSANGRG